MPGYFITVEGIEGAGKTTIVKRLTNLLQEMGHPCVSCREPGGTEAAELIRNLLLDASIPLYPETELLLMEAARAQLMREIVLPSLEAGKIVLLDRHGDSTLAYQGFGRGLEADSILWLNRFAANRRSPDLTLLLDVDVRMGLARTRKRNSPSAASDRFESETIEFLERARQGFLSMARNEPERFCVVSTNVGEEEMWAQTERAVLDRLQNLGVVAKGL
ncbi:MAG: dTMP kinase [Candidatus Omnitrophota bacterium]